MPTRLPSLRQPPIGFGHRGARAHAPENTIESFQLALKLGATGLESDVWSTSDGVAVLDHDGLVRTGLRRRSISQLSLAEIRTSAEHIPTAAEFYAECGSDFEFSVDVKDPVAVPSLLEAAQSSDAAACGRLWLCHDDHELLTSWRELETRVRLVDSTRLRKLKDGPERHAARMEASGIDALNLHHTDWTGGLVALFHRFGLLTFGWDAQFERVLASLLDMGIDAVYSDHVDRMVQALDAAYPPASSS